MTTIPTTSTEARPTSRQRAGLLLSGIYFVLNLPSVLEAAPDGEVGPPMSVMVLSTALSVLGLLATVLAWRSLTRVWTRVLAACLVVITLTSLPALFVDVPAVVKALVAVGIVWTLVALVLVFSERETDAGA